MADNQASCRQCGNELAAKDWTCPRCGAIIDRFLFSTVSLKSLDDEGRKAYHFGYKDCIKRSSETGSSVIQPENYHPQGGKETEYRAGWQAASEKVEAKADRKFGRRRGLIVLGSGIALLLVGLAIAYGTLNATKGHVVLIAYTPIGLGVMNIVIGIVMIMTGYNDEARPPMPSSQPPAPRDVSSEARISSEATRGEDLHYDLAINFEDAVFGSQVEIVISHPESTCLICGGKGVIGSPVGSLPSTRATCGRCGGKGITAKTIRELKVHVPAGVADGNRLRLVGEGGHGLPAGDLYVVLSVAKHAYFERQGFDLHCVARLAHENEVRPSAVTIDTLEGPLKLPVPGSGESEVVLKGKGVCRLDGSGRGDLIVHFPEWKAPTDARSR
jgi:hypothetical protein